MSPRLGLDLLQILQAAAEIADTNGLDAVTLASLAKKLGIRPPSLYNHIDGLPGLRHKLAVYGMKRLNEAMTFAAVGRSEDDAVHAIAKAYITFAREHPGLYDATVRAADWQDPETQKAGEEPIELIVRIFRVYGLEGDAAIHIVRGLRSILHGFSALARTGNFNIPLHPDDSLELLIDIFLAGIRSKSANKA
ncbi:TetR/AcrR family transcriptional regulator [Paenibacillus caui]|uniref:TetR/AcrR family transcriptional regulator n=1 Tax=Paenibacillus caui TaxID=2873927 RepID=UPI001CA9B7CD|nr:TetR/AcrR family transcriptional regulator [Paenibacillus caui]